MDEKLIHHGIFTTPAGLSPRPSDTASVTRSSSAPSQSRNSKNRVGKESKQVPKIFGRSRKDVKNHPCTIGNDMQSPGGQRLAEQDETVKLSSFLDSESQHDDEGRLKSPVTIALKRESVNSDLSNRFYGDESSSERSHVEPKIREPLREDCGYETHGILQVTSHTTEECPAENSAQKHVEISRETRSKIKPESYRTGEQDSINRRYKLRVSGYTVEDFVTDDSDSAFSAKWKRNHEKRQHTVKKNHRARKSYSHRQFKTSRTRGKNHRDRYSFSRRSARYGPRIHRSHKRGNKNPMREPEKSPARGKRDVRFSKDHKLQSISDISQTGSEITSNGKASEGSTNSESCLGPLDFKVEREKKPNVTGCTKIADGPVNSNQKCAKIRSKLICIGSLFLFLVLFDVGMVMTLLRERKGSDENQTSEVSGAADFIDRNNSTRRAEMIMSVSVPSSICLEWVPGQGKSTLCNGFSKQFPSATGDPRRFPGSVLKGFAKEASITEISPHNVGSLGDLVAHAVLNQTRLMVGSKFGSIDVALIHSGMLQADLPAGNFPLSSAPDVFDFGGKIARDPSRGGLVVLELSGADLQNTIAQAVARSLSESNYQCCTMEGSGRFPNGSVYPYTAGLRFSVLHFPCNHRDGKEGEYSPIVYVEVSQPSTDELLPNRFLRGSHDDSGHEESVWLPMDERNRAVSFVSKSRARKLRTTRQRDEPKRWTTIESDRFYRIVTTKYLKDGGEGYNFKAAPDERAEGNNSAFLQKTAFQAFLEYAITSGSLEVPEASTKRFLVAHEPNGHICS